MRLMETSPAEKDPSPTLDIIFYYLVIYPSFLKALGSYCCQSSGMKAPARTSISEITPFWRQRQDGGRNKEAMLLGGTFIIEWQIVEQSASLGAKWCWGRQSLLFLGWIEMVLGLQMNRDVHSISKYNFTVTDSVIWNAWAGGGKTQVLVELIIFHAEVHVLVRLLYFQSVRLDINRTKVIIESQFHS